MSIIRNEIVIEFFSESLELNYLDIISLGVCVVPEYYIFKLLKRPFKLKCIADEPLQQRKEPVFVFIVDQTIMKYSLRLMSPETDQLLFRCQRLSSDLQYPLKDLGKISKIKSIMTFGGSRQQLIPNFGVNLN